MSLQEPTRPAMPGERQQESAVDEALAESFPASDPPSWNTGIARLVSPGRPATDTARNGSSHTFAQVLISSAGAAGIALLVPIVVLLVGLPVALAVRGAIELLQWLATVLS